MAILAECPVCHRQQAVGNKRCKGTIQGIPCGEDLDKAKRAGRVRYYITYRLGGKQRKEFVSASISEARDADGKRKVQKREGKIFDILPENKLTFKEITEWYEGLNSVKKLASYDRVKLALSNFNEVFGDTRVSDIKAADLEDYQVKRESEGRAPATIDMEVKIMQTALIKADDNDMIDSRCLKAFRRTKRLLKRGDNARGRVLKPEEIIALMDNAKGHLKPILTFALYTGMRAGEIRGLRWPYIDQKNMFIRLPQDVTKENRVKNIPINGAMASILKDLGKVRRLDHDFVFLYRKKPITQRNGFKKAFITLCNDAGISYGRKVFSGITFHDIRRTVKTGMLSAGLDPVHRDVILGHSLKGMDRHYMVPQEKELQYAMDKYTAWFDATIQEVRDREKEQEKTAAAAG